MRGGNEVPDEAIQPFTKKDRLLSLDCFVGKLRFPPRNDGQNLNGETVYSYLSAMRRRRPALFAIIDNGCFISERLYRGYAFKHLIKSSGHDTIKF
jgi:hypothetical protein